LVAPNNTPSACHGPYRRRPFDSLTLRRADGRFPARRPLFTLSPIIPPSFYPPPKLLSLAPTSFFLNDLMVFSFLFGFTSSFPRRAPPPPPFSVIINKAPSLSLSFGCCCFLSKLFFRPYVARPDGVSHRYTKNVPLPPLFPPLATKLLGPEVGGFLVNSFSHGSCPLFPLVLGLFVAFVPDFLEE